MRMVSRWVRLVGAAVLVAASVVAMGANGCGSSLHKADVAAGAIAASLHTAATVNHSNVLETADERKQVAQYIVQAAAANDAFIGVLKDAEAAGTPDPAAITAGFQALAARVSDLQTLGVLHINSPQARAEFATVMAAIQVSLGTLQGLYAGATTQAAPGGLAAAAVFSGSEIVELVDLAVAAGSTLVPKLLALKGQGDVEILAEASEDDEDAEEIAEEDGADKPSGS